MCDVDKFPPLLFMLDFFLAAGTDWSKETIMSFNASLSQTVEEEEEEGGSFLSLFAQWQYLIYNI